MRRDTSWASPRTDPSQAGRGSPSGPRVLTVCHEGRVEVQDASVAYRVRAGYVHSDGRAFLHACARFRSFLGPRLHAWRDSEAIGGGSVTGFGSPSPAGCFSPWHSWSGLPPSWSQGLTATVRVAPPWWCSHSCWSAWSPWTPSAGESSLLFAVSSSTAGSGVTPEHSGGPVSSRRHAGRGDPRSASVVRRSE